ncbi:MAG: hypothetical protein M0Q92_00700 [Methanoregula sp.]|jgi:hypothetical protein|nr:hypothetical protein [Methanoregula sp.]
MTKFKQNYSLFYKITPKESWDSINGLTECIYKINGTWIDLELHNYLFHRLFSKFAEDTESAEGKMILYVLPSIAKDIYIHLDILRKIIEDNVFKILKDSNFKTLHNKEKNFWKLIRIARDNIIIHKEKSFYYKQSISITSTDPQHFMVFQLYLKQPNPEKLKSVELKPLTDIAKMESILRSYESYLEQNY